jgi:PAS domain S-box-containing protein
MENRTPGHGASPQGSSKPAQNARQGEDLSTLERDVVDNALDCIIVISADGRVAEWNPAAERTFGYTRAEMLGQLLHEHIMLPEDAALHRAALQNLANGAAPRLIGERLEMKASRKDGQVLDIELAIARTQNGGPPRFIGFVRDITVRRRQEHALRESHKRLEQSQRIGRVGSWHLDLQTSVMTWSEQTYRIFGRDPATYKVDLDDVNNQMHPDDKEVVLAAFYKAIEENRPHEIEHRIVMPDGSVRHVWEHCEFHPGDDGKPRYATGTCQDITDRRVADQQLRDSKERIRRIVDYSNDAVLLSDGRGKVTFASPVIERITGYSAEEFLHLNFFEQVHAADRQKLKDFSERVFASPGVPLRSQYRIRRKDEEWVWIEVTATNWRHEPAIGSIVANLRDVSERVSLEEQLNHATKMEGIGRLAGGVAHDFNNLLTAITGYAQLLEARLAHDSVLEAHAQRIIDAAGRATDLTRQLLAFSRKQILQPVVLDINARVKGMESLLLHIIGEDIELKTVLAADLRPVRADPSQVDQVIMNLAVNARDAMPRGGRLLIETENVHLDESYTATRPDVVAGKHVQISVTDNGVGMDAATRSRVFEPFFTTKGPGKGTGLGLATVYGIVRQSGGHIWLYSEPSAGTVFKIYIPASDGTPAVTAPARDALPAGGTETVLVAEDEDAVRQLVGEVLTQAGYKVISAPNGHKALEMAQGVPVELLLTDVVMPGMSGATLARQVQAMSPQIKVIFMSGYTDEAIVDHGMLIEGIEFLQKPFSPAVLLRRVRHVLDSGP